MDMIMIIRHMYIGIVNTSNTDTQEGCAILSVVFLFVTPKFAGFFYAAKEEEEKKPPQQQEISWCERT